MFRRSLAAAALLFAGPALGQPAPAPEAQQAPELVVISFAYTIPTAEFRARMDAAAPHLAAIPGLRWKVWAIDEVARRASGIYLFADSAAGETYLTGIFAEHMGRNSALADIAIRRYGVMEEATRLTRGRLD